MKPGAIIAGTGIYKVPGMGPAEVVETPFGESVYFRLDGENLIFLARHGLEHTMPPHKINYRANMWALEQMGVERVLSTYAVGSLRPDIPAGSLVLLDDFLDFTVNRITTFYDGEEWGVGHADFTMPYCSRLGQALLSGAADHDLSLRTNGTYVCKDGPRMESPAEVRMLAQVGGDVVGMTGVPEVVLARELGLHFAAVAVSINLGIGLEHELHVVHHLDKERENLTKLFINVLREELPTGRCHCCNSVDFLKLPVPQCLPKRASRE